MTEADKKISAAIEAGKSFLLDAGAGSGKTASLVQALLLLKAERRGDLVATNQQIACITYTRAARDEIVDRTEHDEVFRVSTIHDFLWSQINPFQAELRTALVEHNASLKASSRKKQNPDELKLAVSSVSAIQYSDRGAKFLEGRIHHDDVIAISGIMFRNHALLPKLVGSRFPYIFVDEYQDTAPVVVEILLDCIRKEAPNTLIGFFGDTAQAIYDNVVGELTEEHQATLELIKKEENYRCSKAVIDVLNRFRTDIQQIPAGNNEEGSAAYVGLHNGMLAEDGYALATGHLVDAPLFEDAKVLYLTHRLIAKRAGYGDLHEAYRVYGGFTKEQFEKGEEAAARCLAFEIDLLAEKWTSGDAGGAIQILNRNGLKLVSFAQKSAMADALDELGRMIDEGRSISEVVSHVDAQSLLKIVDRLKDGLALGSKDEADVDEDDRRLWKLFHTLQGVSSDQVRAYRKFIEENTPFSTKHGVKGTEFDTVVVVVDDQGASWTKYSFGKCFTGVDTSAARLKRTTNLLYVCLSRARKNLVVLDLGFEDGRRAGVEALFGADNVIIA